jgi:hypothetical protein
MVIVKLELKFEIDDEVRVKDTHEKGTIRSFKIEGYKYNGIKQYTVYYQIQVGAVYNNKWIKEEKLELIDELTTNTDFDNKFELGLLELLINAYLLDKKNIPLIQQLHDEKNLYL